MIAGQPQDGEGIGPGAAETAIALGYQQRRKTGLLDRRPKIAEFAVLAGGKVGEQPLGRVGQQ